MSTVTATFVSTSYEYMPVPRSERERRMAATYTRRRIDALGYDDEDRHLVRGALGLEDA